MALKLDDLIGKKKEVNQVLDLSKATANNADEFKKIMEKIPEFKIKAEKIRPEDIKIQDKDSSRRLRKKKSSSRVKAGEYQFADPVPEEMRAVKLEDLCPVNIQWNMLTTLRPKNKADTEYFSRPLQYMPRARSYISLKSKPPINRTINNKLPPSKPRSSNRLVELGKLELATFEKEKKFPDSWFLRKMKNKAGVQESRYLSCQECGEDFCQKETCAMFQYENFKREPLVEIIGKKEELKRGRPLTKGKKKRSKSTKGKDTSADGRIRKSSKAKSKSRSRSKGGKKFDKDNEQQPQQPKKSSKKKIKGNPLKKKVNRAFQNKSSV